MTLKIGNTYKDQDGENWKIVYQDPDLTDHSDYSYLGVYRSGMTDWFDSRGVSYSQHNRRITLPTTKHEGWVLINPYTVYPTQESAEEAKRAYKSENIIAKVTWESPE